MIGKRIVSVGIWTFVGGWAAYFALAFAFEAYALATNASPSETPLVIIMSVAMLGLPIGLVGWVVEQFEKPEEDC